MISNPKKSVNEFSASLLTDLLAQARAARDRAGRDGASSASGGSAIAAFDADGTLWDTDIGEAFFDWQIRNSGLDGLPADPWAQYRDMKLVDKPAAYAWLAQINAGRPLAQVREWAKAAVDARPDGLPVFQSQKRLIDGLRELGFEIYVVTASIKWAVEPAAARLGIDDDHVLGITTRVSPDGIVGLERVEPITWREGKAQGLLAATGGRRPILASGNTYGDIALLECATDVRLAISTQSERTELFEEERKLWDLAGERGWARHAFVPRPE